MLQELISILRQGLRQRYQHPRHGHAHHSHAFTRCLRALRTCLGPETSKIAILRVYGHDSKKTRRYLCRNYGCVDISVAIWGVSISLSQFGVCRYLCRNLGCVDISVAIWGMSISLSQVFLPGGCPGPSDDCEMRQRYRHTLICDRDIDTTYFATEISTNPKLRQRYRHTLFKDV